MFLTGAKRVIKAGFLSFWRNAVVSLSAILVMTVALFVIGSTMLASVFLESSIQQLNEKVDVNIYFNSDATEDDILKLKNALESLPQVAALTYISKEEAITDFRKRHEDDYLILQALDELNENPLGAIFNIKANDSSQYESIVNFVEGDGALGEGETSSIYSVNYHKNKVVIDKLSQITAGIERVGVAAMFFLIFIAVIITFNTIRLAIYISREEIAVMRLVGANNSYVRGPFVIEGMMYGIIAGLIATALFYPATLWLKGATEGFYGGIDLFNYYILNFNQIFGVILLIGALLGAVSSYLAVRRYLKI